MKRVIKISFVLLLLLCTFFLSIKLEVISAEEVYPFTGMINADALVIYGENNTDTKSITEIAYGTRVNVLETVENKNQKGCSLYKISFDGNIGYACKSYIINLASISSKTDVSNVETYQEYSAKLKEAGFPDSYHPYLYYMHAKHPTWIFKADVINNTLTDLAKAQETKKKGALQTSNQNYWISDKMHEAGGYYLVNASVIASFMDPRNSLFEDRVFQFLDLDDTKDLASNNTLINMVGEHGALKQYLPAFQQAASTHGINVVHLVSRSKQEGNNATKLDTKTGEYYPTYNPSNGKYTTNTGTKYNGKSLDGFYNFYNIGAYNANGLTPQARAVAYAAGYLEPNATTLSLGRPWDTPEKGIIGGAEFVVNSYVKKGQDTIYYQKFNVSSYRTNEIHSNQYMTNLMAPASEGLSMRNSYLNSGEIDLPFIFTIPVFKDMDDNYQPSVKNTNSKLSTITINDKVINGFSDDVIEYVQNVVTDKTTVKIGAKTQAETSRIEGTGDYTFDNKKVTVSLIVTAEDGSKTTYKIILTQVLPENNIKVEDILAKLAVKVNENYMYGISINTQVSEISNTIIKNGGEVKITDDSDNVVKSGIMKTGYKIIINGSEDSKTFVIAVRGDVNGDGNIDLKDFVLIQSHILKKNILSEEKFYAGDVNYDGSIVLADFVLVQSHILNKSKL